MPFSIDSLKQAGDRFHVTFNNGSSDRFIDRDDVSDGQVRFRVSGDSRTIACEPGKLRAVLTVTEEDHKIAQAWFGSNPLPI